MRTALRRAGDRFAELVIDLDPAAPATDHWTVADTVAHVTAIAELYTELVAGSAFGASRPDLVDAIAVVTVDTLAELNANKLAGYPTRDVGELITRLRAAIETVLDRTLTADPAIPLPWLGGSRVPIGGILAHLVNELHVHGWDIARATRSRWEIPPAEAALFFDMFLVGIIRCGLGTLLDGGDAPRDRPIAVTFRSRYTDPVTVVLERGEVRIRDGAGPVDARVRFEPAALNLMLFHRMSRLRAALTGAVVISGRRPWLLAPFLRTVRLP